MATRWLISATGTARWFAVLGLVLATSLLAFLVNYLSAIPTRSPSQTELSSTQQLQAGSEGVETPWQPVQVGALPIYVQSAIVDVRRPSPGLHQVALQAWTDVRLWPTSFCCCFRSAGGAFAEARASSWKRFNIGELQSSQFRCNVSVDFRPATVTFAVNSCLEERPSAMLPVEFPILHPGEVAVCTKIAYSKLSIQRLYEWFEIQQLLGVTRVVTFRFRDLEERSLRVLEFYEKQGLLTILPFVLPGKLEKHPRGFLASERLEGQMYADTQVSVMDCALRLAGFSHVAVIDFDEIIVPRATSLKDLHLPTFFKKLDMLCPTCAGYTFHIENFVSNWTEGMRSAGPFFHTRYVQRTVPEFDRVKVVHRPALTSMVATHRIVPASNNEIRKVMPSLAAVHHYRTCRPYWSKQRCMESARIHDDRLLLLEEALIARFKTLRDLQAGVPGPGQ